MKWRIGLLAVLLGLAGCGPRPVAQEPAIGDSATATDGAPAIAWSFDEHPLDVAPLDRPSILEDPKQTDTEVDIQPSASSDQLIQRIVRERPEIASPDADDWTIVNALRSWAYEHTVFAATASVLLDYDPAIDLYAADAATVFEWFEEWRGGVWCGGTAHALMRLYQLFGYEANALDIGKPGRSTHVVTLVQIRHDGRAVLCVQDAYFDLTFEHPDGAPYDYLEMLRMLRRKSTGEIEMRRDASIETWALAELPNGSRTQTFESAVPPAAAELDSAEPVGRGRFRYAWLRTLENFDELVIQPTIEFLVEEGNPPELIYLFRYPFAIYGPGADVLAWQLQRALDNR